MLTCFYSAHEKQLLRALTLPAFLTVKVEPKSDADLKWERNCEDYGPDGHKKEASHQHEPSTFKLHQQVLKQ